MPRTGSLLLTLFALGALGPAVGCAYFAPTPPLAAAPSAEFVTGDLPVPDGFRLDRAASWRHERTTYRRYQLLYRRTEYLSEDRVREFFLEAYAAAGWTPEFVYGLSESRILFVKGAEECAVRIRERFAERNTEIEITVQPRQTPEGGLVAREGWAEDASAPVPSSATATETNAPRAAGPGETLK